MTRLTTVIVWLSLIHVSESQNGQCSVQCESNLCESRELECCWCERLHYGPYQTCSCCPTGFSCCPFRLYSSGAYAVRPMCCPSGETCDTVGGRCINESGTKATASETVASHCDPIYLSITVDDILLALYIDGHHVPQDLLPNHNNWNLADKISISAGTRLIAVSVQDRLAPGGLLASVTGDIMLTDASWKCSRNTDGVGQTWMTPGYDDSKWPPAIVSLPNTGVRAWSVVSGISPAANWIWTKRYDDNPTVMEPYVYCRGHFVSHVNLCDKSVGGCGNLCKLQDKECCLCEMVHVGPTKVCSCCPRGTHCCSFKPSADNSVGPVCCPTGSTCSADGRCVTSSPAVSANITSGTCSLKKVAKSRLFRGEDDYNEV